MRTSKRLLPAHLGEEVVGLRGEVGDLRALDVALRLREHAVARLHRQVLARVRNREHNLLQRAVVAHDLHSESLYQSFASIRASLMLNSQCVSLILHPMSSNHLMNAFLNADVYSYARYCHKNQQSNKVTKKTPPTCSNTPRFHLNIKVAP